MRRAVLNGVLGLALTAAFAIGGVARAESDRGGWAAEDRHAAAERGPDPFQLALRSVEALRAETDDVDFSWESGPWLDAASFAMARRRVWRDDPADGAEATPYFGAGFGGIALGDQRLQAKFVTGFATAVTKDAVVYTEYQHIRDLGFGGFDDVDHRFEAGIRRRF